MDILVGEVCYQRSSTGVCTRPQYLARKVRLFLLLGNLAVIADLAADAGGADGVRCSRRGSNK
jgi:hypothetical protein